jgi:hypothetical protein
MPSILPHGAPQRGQEGYARFQLLRSVAEP